MHNLQQVQIPKRESYKRLEVLGTVNNPKPRLQRRRPKSVDQRQVTSEVEVNASHSKVRKAANQVNVVSDENEQLIKQ